MSQFKVGDKVIRGCGKYHGEVLNILPPEMMINGELKPVAKGKRLVIAAYNEMTGKVSITARCIDGTIDGNDRQMYAYRKMRPMITTKDLWVFVYTYDGKVAQTFTTPSEKDVKVMREAKHLTILSETYIPGKTMEVPEK